MSLLARYSIPTSIISNFFDDFYPTTSVYPTYSKKHKFVPVDESTTRLEVELPGYHKNDIEIYTEKGNLVVSAKNQSEHSSRSFNYSWRIHEYEKIEKVRYENGMLLVDIKKLLPDEHKRKIYQIE